jgi:hypothetical protein
MQALRSKITDVEENKNQKLQAVVAALCASMNAKVLFGPRSAS